MNTKLTYELISKVYDLLDVFYFNKESTSPRKAAYELVQRENAKILEVCTGTAANTIYIAERMKKSKIVGIDLSEDMLKLAKEKVLKKKLDNIELHAMDATKIKFKDKTFDVVLISLVLHEIDEELAKQMLIEAKRVLKAGGNIIVVEWEQPQKIIKKIMFLLIRLLEPKGFSGFLKLDMKQYFNQYGLYIENEKHCDYSKVIKLSCDK